MVRNPSAVQETRVQSLGWEDPLEKGMATHSSIRTWRIPLTEEPGGLQPMGLRRVGHDWVTNTFIKKKKISSLFCYYFKWKLITLQYCGGLCHSLTWISHGCTCVPSSWTPSPCLPIPSLWAVHCTSFEFTLMSFIPLISFLDLLYRFGSTSSPTLSLFFPSSPLFLFPRYCLGSSSLVIVYCPWWISFIPIASVLPLNGWLPGWLPNLCPDPYLISRSVSALGFTTGASNFILLQTLPLIRAPAAFCPILHPSSLLD